MSNDRPSGAPSDRVAVVGGGIMGNGIAQLAAMAGDAAAVHDLDETTLQRSRAAIHTSLARFVKRGSLSAGEAGEALDRITFTTELGAAVDGADVVIEAVSEFLDVKREVWTAIASQAPRSALLGTNTSQLSITSIASVLGDDAPRLVGIHFFNPPVMMRLVELIAGTLTADAEVQRARAFATKLGKEVVVCRKDSPGFITSRAYAILRLECIRMLEEGIATAEDIDTALKLGFNFPMGPLELGDMNGLDTYLQAISSLATAHGERFRPTVGLRNMVAANRLGRKTGAGFYTYNEDGTRAQDRQG